MTPADDPVERMAQQMDSVCAAALPADSGAVFEWCQAAYSTMKDSAALLRALRDERDGAIAQLANAVICLRETVNGEWGNEAFDEHHDNWLTPDTALPTKGST